MANAGFDQGRRGPQHHRQPDGCGSTITGATYAWSQVLTAGQTNLDKVTFTPVAGQHSDVSFTASVLHAFPMSNTPLTFRLAVTVGGVTKTDDVVDLATLGRGVDHDGEVEAR